MKLKSIQISLFALVFLIFISLFIPSNVTAEENEECVSIGFFVKDEDREPIEGAMVSIEWLNNYRMDRLTNEKGLVSVPLKPAHYTITIQHDNYTTFEDEIQISKPSTFTYMLEPKGGSDRSEICNSCLPSIFILSIFLGFGLIYKRKKVSDTNQLHHSLNGGEKS